MLNIGPAELMVILVIALLVLGPNKLPDAARQVGRALGELRRLSSGFQAEMRDALREPVETKPGSATPRPAAAAAAAAKAGGALASPRPPAGEVVAGDGATETGAIANGAGATGATGGEDPVGPEKSATEPGGNGTSPR
ncbi:MAG: Sec-independent protein translocase protein TatB [Actinomycetota bacterium]|nr:Sec-independent protein translocase protein TatB [Actinomycetota bacterium]